MKQENRLAETKIKASKIKDFEGFRIFRKGFSG
jgi:hypothetical protein